MAAVLSLRAYLTDTATAMPTGLRAVLRAAGSGSLRDLLRRDRDAATVSWVGCGPPVTVGDGPGVQERITIVVLADGYARRSQSVFVAEVDRLFRPGLLALDVFHDNISSFRVVRLGLVSADDGISHTMRQNNRPPFHIGADTALGLDFDDDDFGNAGFQPYSDATYRSIAKALRIWRLDADIVVVQANVAGSWGKWSNRMMALSPGMSEHVLAHELGHCFGLADEYVGAAFSPPAATKTYADGEPAARNLTKQTDRTQLTAKKWGGLIAATTAVPTPSAPPGWDSAKDVGLFEGGLREFAKGVYRPSDDCRMRNASATTLFCRVCRTEVERGIRYAIEHQGQPAGGGLPGGGTEAMVTLRRRPDGTQVVIGIAPVRRSALLGSPRADVLADAVFLGDEVLAATPVPDIESHAFRGDRDVVEHVPAGEDDVLQVRLPADRLSDLAEGRVRVGRVAVAADDDAVDRPWLESISAARRVLEPHAVLRVESSVADVLQAMRQGPR